MPPRGPPGHGEDPARQGGREFVLGGNVRSDLPAEGSRGSFEYWAVVGQAAGGPGRLDLVPAGGSGSSGEGGAWAAVDGDTGARLPSLQPTSVPGELLGLLRQALRNASDQNSSECLPFLACLTGARGAAHLARMPLPALFPFARAFAEGVAPHSRQYAQLFSPSLLGALSA